MVRRLNLKVQSISLMLTCGNLFSKPIVMNLINGDCLDKMKDLPNKSVDCFIMDLPYGTTACKWDIKIDLDDLWIQLKRLARNKNTPYFFFCDMKLAVDIINSNRKWFRYDIVIQKSRIVGFLNSKRMPRRNHELLLVFYDKSPTYNVVDNHKIISIRKNKNSDSIYGKLIKPTLNTYNPPLPVSIIKMVNTTGKKYHKTQKAQDILEWIIKYYTNENDYVLDPTMGSGSTGVACKNLNRNFIGIEMDGEYFKIAQERTK